MSRCDGKAEGRERHALADRPAATQAAGDALFVLASEIADFANERTENLPFGEHANLMELEARLLAYAKLLSAFDRDGFVRRELEQAAEHFAYVRSRIGGAL